MRFELENTSESLKTELDNLKKLYDQSLKDADMSRKKLKTNEEERNDLQTKISKLVCDLENARSSKDVTYGEMSELRKEIGDLKLKVCEVDNEKSTAIREFERERERCRILEQKIANSEAMMKREQGDAKRRIEDLEERLDKAQNLHRTVNEEHLSETRQANDEINELRGCVKNLKENLSGETSVPRSLNKASLQLHTNFSRSEKGISSILSWRSVLRMRVSSCRFGAPDRGGSSQRRISPQCQRQIEERVGVFEQDGRRRRFGTRAPNGATIR